MRCAKTARLMVDRTSLARGPFRVAPEVAQQLGADVVVREGAERGAVGAELAEGLDDSAGGWEKLSSQVVGQQPGSAKYHGDVPGVHGGVEGTGRGGTRRGKGALR